MERLEVFTLGKHYLQVHTEKGFTLYANAKLVNGQLTSYTDKMVRRGGSWVIDVWRFLNKKDFPINPIYTAVFGFDSEDTAVSVNATDIDVESISGVNGQLVDIGNISLPVGQALPVTPLIGAEYEQITLKMVDGVLNLPSYFDDSFRVFKAEGLFKRKSDRVENQYYCYDFDRMVFSGYIEGQSIGGVSPKVNEILSITIDGQFNMRTDAVTKYDYSNQASHNKFIWTPEKMLGLDNVETESAFKLSLTNGLHSLSVMVIA